MNRMLLVVLLTMLLLPLCAATLNDGVVTVMGSGYFMEHKGDSVFMCNYYKGDQYPEMNGAYQFLAQTTMIFLMVIHDFDTISNSTWKDQIDHVDKIACPWTNGFSGFVVSIPMDEITYRYDMDDLESMGEEELFRRIKEYINFYGDRSPISMY